MSKERYNQIIDEVYKNYLGRYKQDKTPGIVYYTDPLQFRPYTEEEFTNRIKTNKELSERWGLKIEERELSLEERYKLVNIISKEKLPGEPSYTEEQQHSMLDELTPKRAISLTYYNEKLEIYE